MVVVSHDVAIATPANEYDEPRELANAKPMKTGRTAIATPRELPARFLLPSESSPKSSLHLIPAKAATNSIPARRYAGTEVSKTPLKS